MKTIILPYKKLDGVSIQEDKIKGGIEKFAKNLYEYSEHRIIPVEFTEEDQRARRVTDMVVKAALQYKADMVWANYDNAPLTTRLQAVLDIPVAWIVHNLGTSISKVNVVQFMPDFISNGGSIFMVSEYSHETWKNLSARINGPDVELPISGYIHSSCSNGTEYITSEKDYDLCSVGRCDKGKDPFAPNRKLEKLDTDLKSLVITTSYRIHKNKEYYDKNKHWNYDNFETKWDLRHSTVLDHIAKSKVFVSTCTGESWGITTFEALSHGVPVILLCDGKLQHASECIAAKDDHIVKLKKGCKPQEFLDAVEDLSKYDESKRREIFELTNQKHSKDKWLESVNKIIETTLEKYDGSGLNTLVD